MNLNYIAVKICMYLNHYLFTQFRCLGDEFFELGNNDFLATERKKPTLLKGVEQI